MAAYAHHALVQDYESEGILYIYIENYHTYAPKITSTLMSPSYPLYQAPITPLPHFEEFPFNGRI